MLKSQKQPPGRIFLLSPADLSGVRGRLILNEHAPFELAARLRKQGLPLGELFSFVSGLYFRGKLAYARAFARAPVGVPGISVITTCRGLLPPERPITPIELREMTAVPIEPLDLRYRAPLRHDVRMISELAPEGCEIVLLGSIATAKYVEPLLEILGERLLFPAEFVGRGDLSRGGLLLRCVSAGTELSYTPVAGALCRGPRPPALPCPGASTPRY